MTAGGARGKVLVLGAGETSFLSVIRSLGRQGIEVHVGWCPPRSLACRSRYVRAIHALPPYDPADDAWKGALLALCERERFDLIVPTNDPSVIPVQHLGPELARFCRAVYTLSDEAFAVGFDKFRSYDLARSLGIPVPRHRVLPLPVDPATILAEFRLPVVLKPRASYVSEDFGQRRRVRIAVDAAELAALLRGLDGQAEVLVEEYFRGESGGIDFLAYEGQVLATFQHVRLHEGRSYSASPYRMSVPVHADLARAGTTLVRALRYTGVIMFEYRLDRATGAFVIHDVNARFWAALPVTVAAGADFPFWLYQMLVEGRRDFPQAYRPGVYCRNWRLDILWLRESVLDTGSERVPARQLLGELGRIVTLREYNDTLAWDDPRPGLHDFSQLARRFARALVRRTRRPFTPGPTARRQAPTP